MPRNRDFDGHIRGRDEMCGNLLGCGDGPASFNAEATALGHEVLSCDPLYAFSADDIRRRVEACYDTVIAQVEQDQDGFVWSYFRDADHLGQCRLAAMRRFLADFEAGSRQGRYIPASLPRLPFGDGQFFLALVSHLLFLYSEQLRRDFHLAAFEDLLRVAGEVRVFPSWASTAGGPRTSAPSGNTWSGAASRSRSPP